jgi:hypothetical protein
MRTTNYENCIRLMAEVAAATALLFVLATVLGFMLAN